MVEIFHSPAPATAATGGTTTTTSRVLWDRKADGGFPETKELKRRVRDVIEPGRDLGHVDRHDGKEAPSGPKPDGGAPAAGAGGQEGKPSGAAGQAGGGYPGSSEAAAQLVDDLQGGGKEVCEDCN